MLGLIIIVVASTTFPAIKKSIEIHSETRKWNEKWADRVEAVSKANLEEFAHAKKVPANVTQDLSLSLADSPWVIDSHVTIQEGVTLSIEPGVEIFIAPRADIQVYGRIIALGEAARKIRLDPLK